MTPEPAAIVIDAIVIAANPRAALRIAGLSARERAVRVAGRVGAERVFVVDAAADLARLPAWWGERRARLLVIRADQLVHTPLVAPLVAGELASAAIAIAVGPDAGYAGALLAGPDAGAAVIARLAGGASDTEVAAGAEARIPHGDIARHALDTPADRRAAHQLLYRILHKPQDNAITRYLFRPLSFPLTRMLAHTPVTPNQISYAVGVLVAIGCWLTADASYARATLGAGIVLFASYLDCCDGEIARLKLRSSRFGAWVDTVVDELSSIAYMLVLGYHCYLRFGPGGPWLPALAVGAVTYAWCMYAVYYNIIVAVGSANSQDYVARFEVVPGRAPGAVRLAPVVPVETPSTLPPWIAAPLRWLPNMARRDFLVWMCFVLAALHATRVSFAIQIVGGAITALVLGADHVRLRRLRREVRRSGRVLEPPR